MKPSFALAACVFLGLFASSPAARARELLSDIPLRWSPTTQPGREGTLEVPRVRVRIGAFRDARPRRDLIGENREDPPKPVRPVTTRENVPAWVAAHLREVGRRYGFQVVDANPDVVLSGEVRRFFVTEENTYKGQVTLALTARRPGGRVLWSGTVTGDATRFGRSYRADNYCEVLSDALVDVVKHLLEEGKFTRAVRGGGGGR